jgi:asparagine synthase (glutamine-hydrolysing)
MCGFIALISHSKSEERRSLVERMLSTIRHRGPDGEGILIDQTAALGFRRLSILDLSHLGDQPMTSTDGSCTIVFNGEIFNYLELRQELQSLGRIFRSQSDTEVLLNAYIEWGHACVERLNGMWAFVIIDRNTGKLFGSRDRFGIKPLYRWSGGGQTIIASEIKAIRASGLYRDEINSGVVSDYLLGGRLDESAATFFKGIDQLPAGYSFEVGADGSSHQWRFWDLRTISERPNDEAPAAFAGLFEDAVRLHMRSDVPVGVHLSGGMDSTSIICASSRVQSEAGASGKLKAFSYADTEYDESQYIDATLARTGIELVTLKTDANRVWEDLPRMLRYQDEPVHSLTAVVGFQLMQLTQEHGIRVILNGQGADETLGGYPSYFRDGWVTLLKEGGLLPAWREVGRYALTTGGIRRALFIKLLRHVMQTHMRALPQYRRLAKQRYRARLKNVSWVNPALALSASDIPESDGADLRSTLLQSVEMSPLPLYLRVEDRNSMAHSIETRLPFLDYRLVSLAFSLERQWKLNGSLNKFVLREAMRGRIPELVRARQDKMGFPTAATRWFRNELYPKIREVFIDLGGAATDYLHRQTLLDHLEQHRTGQANHAEPLFRAMQFLLWKDSLNDVIDGSSPSPV